MRETYIANQSFGVVVGVTAFKVNEGESVDIVQLDSAYNKVLVDYGAGMMDWMSANTFHLRFNKKDA